MKPYVSPELLVYLKQMFPDRCARAGMTSEQVWSESGASRVVAHLDSVFQDQVAESLRATS